MGSIINKSHFEAKVNLDGGSRVSTSASRTKGVLRKYGSTLKKSCQRPLTFHFWLACITLDDLGKHFFDEDREFGGREIDTVDTVPSQQ